MELPEKITGRNILSPKITDVLKTDMPGEGEVWITTKIANILKLKEGDEVSLRLADESITVKIAKIVVDPVFGSSSTNVYRMWCGYGRLADFPMAENNAVSYLEIRFDEYDHESEQNFIQDAEAYFDMPLGNALYTYDTIKSGYTGVYQMVGAIFCFVSVILVITVAWLTIFLIKSDMDEDIRNIGICKSLGMTGVQIVGGYLVCYGAIGFVGAALGSITGGWLSKRIIISILGDIGIYTVSFPRAMSQARALVCVFDECREGLMPCSSAAGYLTTGIFGYQFLVWITVLSAILLICFCSIFKVYRLNASYAIRKGVWQQEEKSKKKQHNTRYNNKMPFEFYYAVRGMQDKKLRYLYIAAVSLILSSLTIVCTGCLNAVRNIDKDPETWGFIKTDIYVTSAGDTPVSAIIDELKKDPNIDYTYGVNKVYVTYKPDDKSTYQSITTELYEMPWNEKIKDRALYGRRPDSENEIGVGLGLAQEYGLDVGEKIELFVNGERGEYEITEIFQTLSNSGKVLRMVTDNLDEFVEANGSYGDYMLVLKNAYDKWEYAEELTGKYDGKFAFIASKSNGENFTGVLAPAVGMILTVLVIVIILITVNLTFLLVKREQSLIGLLKAVGMTSWQVLKIYLCRNCLSAMVGSLLGIVSGAFIIPHLLTPYAKLLGLTKFPFMGSLAGTLTGFVLAPGCMMLGTCVIIKTINKISVKQLVNE